jgi:hypothetical protein
MQVEGGGARSALARSREGAVVARRMKAPFTLLLVALRSEPQLRVLRERLATERAIPSIAQAGPRSASRRCRARTHA